MAAFFHVILSAIPYLLAGLSLIALAIAFWSTNWPRVKGKIDISIYDREWASGSSEAITTFEKKGKFYLLYTYTVAGIAFQGTRLTPLVNIEWQFSGSADLGSAHGEAQWYREGLIVDVYYCPFRPEWACLEPGGFLGAALLGVVAIVAFFAT